MEGWAGCDVERIRRTRNRSVMSESARAFPRRGGGGGDGVACARRHNNRVERTLQQRR